MREHESEGGREGREVVGERGGRREEEAVTAITVWTDSQFHERNSKGAWHNATNVRACGLYDRRYATKIFFTSRRRWSFSFSFLFITPTRDLKIIRLTLEIERFFWNIVSYLNLCFIPPLCVRSIVQGASNNQVLQVSHEIRRMGLDAVVRHDCAQFQKLSTTLYRVGQLRVDETGEHRFVVELRAKVVLLESKQSAQHPFDDPDRQRNRQRVGQPQSQFTSVSNQIERITR